MIKITNPFLRWGISALLALLILFGTYHSIFSLAAFLGCCLMIFFCDRESVLLQLFFVMPMANIFKMSPGSQSFFTLLLLAYVVLHLVLPRKATTFIILFGLYVVLGELFAGSFNLFRTIKLVCNILFLSSTLNIEMKLNHKDFFLRYIVGNLVSSVYGLLDSGPFNIVSYVGVEAYGNPNSDNYVVRFTGLYADPNYYTVGMLISLCLLVVLFYRKEIKVYVLLLFTVPIIYFLIITYSKSAILMLALPAFMLLYTWLKRKNYFTAILFLSAVLLVVLLALSGQIPALNTVVERFMTAETEEGVDINKLTTGRVDLWAMYLKYIINNISTALFGEGIHTPYLEGFAAHNTYIETIFYLGAIGGSLLILCLITISKQSRHSYNKRNFLNYSVLINIGVMYMFLSELFYYDPPFHVFLAFTVLNLPEYKNTEQKIKAGDKK